MSARPEQQGAQILAWYDVHRRDLPWRRPEATPWEVLVSEFMLQQTPVARVIPVWVAWCTRWPEAADLAAASVGDAVRMWGKLGYPRRALRLHATATAITTAHAGRVPTDAATLRTLPGVGEYTAAAVAAFAYGQRIAVVDTNVRRVVHRAVLGHADAGPATTRRDFELTLDLLPADPTTAARTSVAVMELGALVCTAADPGCAGCPVRPSCAWIAAGRPAYDGPARKTQRFTGTDRQVRGRLLDVLRAADATVEKPRLDVVWRDDTQRERALDGLLDDGLVVLTADDRYALPG